MLAAFALVGACATISIVSFTLGRFENDARTQLLSLAKVISLQLKPTQQGLLSRSEPSMYRELNDILVRAQRQSGGIRRIYTIRKNGAYYETALDSSIDPTKPLPPSVLSRAPGVDRDAKDVFDSGIPSVEEGIVRDKAGAYFTAYAPLVDPTGHVVAIVAVDRDANEVVSQIDGLQRAAALALAMALLLGGVFSVIIVRQLARGSKSEAWLRGATSSKKILRATVLELVLTSLALGVLATGVYGQIRMGQLRAEENTSADRTKALDQYRTRIDRVLQDGKKDNRGLSILADAAEKEGLLWLAPSLSAAASADSEHWQEPVWQSEISIKKKEEDERRLRDKLRAAGGEMSERMTSSLVLAILLSFGSLILVRSAAKQQQELLIAKHDSQRHQVAYEQVATNLPIGFYTYRDGEIEDSNAMWETMVTRLPGEQRMMALERVVHEDDFADLERAFKRAQEFGEPFHLQFRLHSSSTELRHFETRGLWVNMPDEGIDNLLGFFLDVTDLVRVQEQLESRNQEVQAKNRMLSRALSDLEENLEAMVHGLVRAVEAKDPYTAGHSERVMQYSMLIGEALGLNAHDLRILERGTLIHDVGKIGVPDAVLNKPARLDPEEFEIIKTHPVIGAEMVRGIPVFEECIPIIHWHHERLNGGGYPDGLSGDEIPMLVRITSVADVFDALTSTRAYRSAMEVDEALSILRKDVESGVLDGKIVEVLADIVKRKGVLWGEDSDRAA